jgi:hypothetical protein
MRYGWLAMCLALFGLTLLALSVVSTHASALEPQRVTNTYDAENDHHVSDKYVTWTDYGNAKTHINSYSIPNGPKNEVYSTGFTGGIYTDLYNDRLVWLEMSFNAVVVKDLGTGSGPSVCFSGQGLQSYISLYGDYAVFLNISVSGGNSYLNMYYCNFKTVGYASIWSHQLPPGWYIQSLDIYNGKAAMVYYEDNVGTRLLTIDVPGGSGATWGDLPSSTSACKLGTVSNGPADLVVCYGWDTGYFTYDLITRTINPVKIGVSDSFYSGFDLSGSTMVFGNTTIDPVLAREIYIYNFINKTVTRLTYDGAYGNYPVICNDKVAYLSNKDQYKDLYLLMIPKNPPDLAVSPGDISAQPAFPIMGEPANVSITVHNLGTSPATGLVILRIKGPQDAGYEKDIADKLTNIPPGSARTMIFQRVFFNGLGPTEVVAIVRTMPNPPNPAEIDPSNNMAKAYIRVVDRPMVIIDVPTEIRELYTYMPVHFSGNQSKDADGIMLYMWDFGDGTAVQGIEVDHAWRDNGFYAVILTVYDIYGTENSTAYGISVLNQIPVPVVDVPPEVARNTTVVLSAAGSYDVDGNIICAYWELDVEPGIKGGLSNGLVIETVFTTTNKTVTVVLHLTDDDFNETVMYYEIQLVDAKAYNVPPIAVIQITTSGLNATFSGQASYDPNGKILSYLWTFSDNSTATGIRVMKTFTPGTYIATLRVKDNESLDGTTSMAVTFSYTQPPVIHQTINQTVINKIQGNLAPSCWAVFSYENSTPGKINFKGWGSDKDGKIAKYEWDFNGDGTWDWSSLTDGNASYIYSKPAFYMAIFRVTDNNGTSTISTLSVSIRPNEIGGKQVKTAETLGTTAMLLVIIIAVVIAMAIAAVVGYVMSKKVATIRKDEAAEQEVAEIKKLVEESKATGANIDEAEALIKQYEGK